MDKVYVVQYMDSDYGILSNIKMFEDKDDAIEFLKNQAIGSGLKFYPTNEYDGTSVIYCEKDINHRRYWVVEWPVERRSK